MNDDNEQRENENLVRPQRRQQQKEKNNLGKMILIGSLFVIAFIMVVIAFIMSMVAISQSATAISQSANWSNQMPVIMKYTTYERIGNTLLLLHTQHTN